MMRAATLAFLVAACAAPRPTLPAGSTVYFAPCERPLQLDSELSGRLVDAFHRLLIEGTNAKAAGSAEEADYVVRTLVSHARLELLESSVDVHVLSNRWNERLAATIVVTHRGEPESPAVVSVRCATSGRQEVAFHDSLDELIDPLRGCDVDPRTGAISDRRGRSVWVLENEGPIGWTQDAWVRVRRETGLPMVEFHTLFERDSNAGPVDASHPQFSVDWRRLVESLSNREAIDQSLPRFDSWSRWAVILRTLGARGRVRDRDLTVEERKLFASLCNRVEYEYGERGPYASLWDQPEHVEIYRWLVARMRDEFDAFEDGYKSLLARNLEPEFCRVVYEMWPPRPEVFRNSFR
ncbi:MAG: hypothetical protein AAGD14_10515 [Planctomycetota bacterium]